jgi:head-tail adaptor
MISGGRLRWVATVSRPSSTLDAFGRRANTWSDVGTIRVDMRENGSSEQAYADGVATVANYELRARWPNIGRLTITELDRITVRGKTLRINGIQNLDERDRLAVIDCTEVL